MRKGQGYLNIILAFVVGMFVMSSFVLMMINYHELKQQANGEKIWVEKK